ncbi:Histidine kinase-, DNA gyrase B-, and HSP90-like ATPase [compost metagenome]
MVREEGQAIVISDRGRGMDSSPGSAGAGLGLSIVNLLLKRMELVSETDSSAQGTTVTILQLPERNLNKI